MQLADVLADWPCVRKCDLEWIKIGRSPSVRRNTNIAQMGAFERSNSLNIWTIKVINTPDLRIIVAVTGVITVCDCIARASNSSTVFGVLAQLTDLNEQ